MRLPSKQPKAPYSYQPVGMNLTASIPRHESKTRTVDAALRAIYAKGIPQRASTTYATLPGSRRAVSSTTSTARKPQVWAQLTTGSRVPASHSLPRRTPTTPIRLTTCWSMWIFARLYG
jgi:hypothetical protein